MSTAVQVPHILVSQVYSLDMSKVIVRVDGSTEPIVFNAAKEARDDKDTGELVILDHKDRVIARFNKAKIVGWWTEKD